MNVIIGNAWPYANGPLHLGRIAVLLPGDILARYHRMMGDEVVFVSGCDSHGTPVTMKAKEEGLTPLEASEKYYNEFVNCFDKLNFSFDLFTKTHSEFHSEKVKEFILQLYDKGYIYEKEMEQFYCSECNEYLNDRYIEGKCPCCGGEALGDQCLECQEIFEAHELLEKSCKVCKCEPEVRTTKHLFFALSKFEGDVKRLYIKQQGWRKSAEIITRRYLDEGLRDRAVTRDFNWGIDVPLEGYEDKKIYVWIEAVMGYLTASIQVLNEKCEDYKEYWDGEDSRVYFVHGKDNIPFHTVIFPAILAGLGFKNPQIREISGEYLKLEGKRFSAAKNWAVWVDRIIDRYNSDSARYFLCLNGPENKESDFTWREFINTTNNELVGMYGNLVNRLFTFIKRNFNGEVPKGYMPEKYKNEIMDIYFKVGDLIEEGEFKEGLSLITKFIKRTNRIFDSLKPWEKVKEDKERCGKELYILVQFVLNGANLYEPFMPVSSQKVKDILGIKKNEWSYIECNLGKVNEIEILFDKIDSKNLNEELEYMNLKKN